ncbi:MULTISPECIES: glycosyltransferase family 4 protein [Clostridium]|uniref:Alpha-monoglucosyldiacylglycerol synthase n=3 Tax=Clostridium TaxID=1485 RepID=D8GIV6_CLOLD|nr:MULTISPECIES: glycosyltransferase family 4 protein [Clostridium]ADK15031.1 predicted glycosyltransferase [Clostridium ljungdahlii DSM 13528]AGY74283.1 glycosyltransferase family 4 protein [Clostridium autoethanogenum DSM 10061]ALU34474.1 Glycosyl transferase group 1 [Clostridium autoethanogenum DSM 10061]OAA87692.1 Alpha-monoglucosyldiacylglycerol synthase [Clostridium ljungdahlii DSM 13528]OVY51194.1 Alpha-monoglucosyldiacylglycerol synthase [Clostridium autoethanogenum]
MKILITTDTYFPMINGVVTSIYNLYKELKNNNYDVKILTLSPTGNEKIIGDICYLKSIGVGIYPNARIKFPFRNRIINRLIDWKPDMIHSQTEFSTLFTAKYIASKINAPQIHTYHTMYEEYLDYLFGGKLIKKSAVGKITRLLLNSLDGVVVPTEKTKKMLLHYGVNKPINVIPTGIDLNKFCRPLLLNEKKEILSTLKIKNTDKVIAYIGRIGKEKNISELIELFNTVVNKVGDVKLLIVGDGPYLQNLKEQVRTEGLGDTVAFTGMIDPKEIYKYYKIADIFVTASTSETQGLTYIEALSSGCPVVCKYDPCIDGIIVQGKNGFSYKESWEFSYYIDKILKNENLKNKLSEEAVHTSKKYSSCIFTHRVIETYSKILNTKCQNITVQ